MFFLTNEILKDKQRTMAYIDNQIKIIDSTIQIYKLKEDTILNYIAIFSEYTNNSNSITNDDLVKLLNNFNDALNLIQINIALLTDMRANFNNLFIDDTLDMDMDIVNINVNNFNDIFAKQSLDISENSIKIETINNNNIPLMQHTLSSSNVELNLPSPIPECIEQDELDTTLSDLDIIENTLIISETNNNVILPYHLDTLNNILANNKNIYKNIEDIIKEQYTLPLDVFSNPVISRFKEAFKLMRIKEQKSIKDAFELGIELLFNYKLHPAIITACNSLDELDAYLDFLENNETHNFKCFNVVFDVPPTLTTK